MKFMECNPFDLAPNPWNPNKVSEDNMKKLKASIERLGSFKPVICRELEDGTLEILGGFHRVQIAKELGLTNIPVYNVGSITDTKAKEITLADNARYGNDDIELLQDVLDDLDLGELGEIMPFSIGEIEALMDNIEAPDLSEIEEKPSGDYITLKFKIEADKGDEIMAHISKIAQSNDYKYKDVVSNYGDALYHSIILESKK